MCEATAFQSYERPNSNLKTLVHWFLDRWFVKPIWRCASMYLSSYISIIVGFVVFFVGFCDRWCSQDLQIGVWFPFGDLWLHVHSLWLPSGTSGSHKTGRVEMMISLEGAPAPPADPPIASARSSPFSHWFSDLVSDWFFLDFGSHSGSILEHFSCFLHPFFEHRICIDFLSIFYKFLVSLIM